MGRISLRRLVGLQLAAVLGGFVLLIALFAIAVATLILAPGPSPAEYEAVLDDLETPPSWEVAHTEIKAPGTLEGCIRLWSSMCPSVTRYYRVDASPDQAFALAEEAIQDAGFTIDEEFDPFCEATSSGAACTFYASSEAVRIDVNVFSPGQGGDDLVAEAEDRIIVRMTVRRAL